MSKQHPPKATRRDFLRFATATSAALLGARAESAETPASDKPISICLISGSLEYKSDESLAKLQSYLEAEYPIRCTRAFRRADDDLPGLEALDTCDAALFFTRRLTIDGEQLARVKRYCDAGRPVIGVRTASHGFQNWLAMDREVFGGDYGKHYGNDLKTRIEIVPAAQDSLLLEGFSPFVSAGSLYRNRAIAGDTTLLLTGTIPDHTEPLAWTRLHRGGRVFYTSLGHPEDFEVAGFRRLLANAIRWTTHRLG